MAQQLLDSAGADLDTASLKIRQIFSSDLEFSAQHRGRATATFWIFVTDLALMWPTNTQDVEGVNSVLKKETKDSPNIGLPLLSARTLVKRIMPLFLDIVTDTSAQQNTPSARRARWT